MASKEVPALLSVHARSSGMILKQVSSQVCYIMYPVFCSASSQLKTKRASATFRRDHLKAGSEQAEVARSQFPMTFPNFSLSERPPEKQDEAFAIDAHPL